MTWAVGLVLVPLTLIMVSAAAWATHGRWRTPGLYWAVVAALLMGAAAVWPALPSPGATVLVREDAYRDGVDSMEIIAAMEQALPRLSDRATSHAFPEGHSWLSTVGPSWLGYLPAALLSTITGPVAAHNLGLGLHLALLALAAWALARTLGAGPVTGLLAAAGAALAPHVLSEVDSASLDRLTLYLTPLFFLCLHRAPSGGKRWAALGGIALAAVFYGQAYYGLYLAAALPLLLLPRLLSRSWRPRLANFVLLVGVAAVLLAPGLYILDRTTAGTSLQRPRQGMAEAFEGRLLSPVAPDRVQKALRAAGKARDGMGAPEERLITAISRSMPLEWVAAPMYMLAGNGAYWLLVLLAVALALDRRRALLASYDVAVLLLLAMGPFARTLASVSDVPLPSYAHMLWVPGFENLKSFGRYMLLASTISTVPLCLGLHGLLERLRRRRGSLPGWIPGATVAAAALLLCFVHLPAWLLDHGSPLGPRRPGADDSLLVTFPHPVARQVPLPASLAGLDPAPALVLPSRQPLALEMRIHPLQAQIPLVNPPGHGPARSPLADTSGGVQVEALARAGVKYVVLYEARMRAEERRPLVESLDRRLKRLASGGGVLVWALPM